MKINRETYESVFVDYLEGNLLDNDLKILVAFLDDNPDLEQELKELISFSKNTEKNIRNTPFFNTNTLIRKPVFDDTDSNFDELCISFYEGLLSEKEEEQLLELTESRSDLLKTFEAYAHTKLRADKSITFPNKSSLKKHKQILWHQYASYAASIILVIGFVFYIQNGKDTLHNTETSPYSYSANSYMDYPKVESFEEESYAYTKASDTEDDSNELMANNTTIQRQNPTNTVRKTIPVTYNKEQLENFEENNPLSYSRKGKLAYSNLSDLEIHLAELFAEKKIDNISISKDLKSKNNVAPKKDRNYKQTIQLATSIDPFEYQKRILGSQPAK